MIFDINLQANNEYNDSAIDYCYFVSVNSLVSIYKENMHQFLTNLFCPSKQLKEII